MTTPTLLDVLERIHAVARAGQTPWVVLDLDSCLFDTGARHLAILRAFADAHPEEARLQALVRRLDASSFRWDVREPLWEAGGFSEALLDALDTFWAPRFFSNLCAVDVPAPGAEPAVWSMYAAGAHLVYLTGRPRPAMAEGTVRGLSSRGFPVLEARAVLYMKPHAGLADVAFKQEAAQQIQALGGQVVAAFDNEPAHVNGFVDAYPGALAICVGAVCSPEPPPLRPEAHRWAGWSAHQTKGTSRLR